MTVHGLWSVWKLIAPILQKVGRDFETDSWIVYNKIRTLVQKKKLLKNPEYSYHTNKRKFCLTQHGSMMDLRLFSGTKLRTKLDTIQNNASSMMNKKNDYISIILFI